MATAYEQEASKWQDVGFYQGHLKQLQEREGQQNKLRSLFEHIFNDPNDELREAKIQEGITNPALHAPTISNYLKAINEEAKTGKNLEAIVDTMPEDRLPLALSLTNPSIKNKKPSKLENYHLIMNIGFEYIKATKGKDEETLEKLAKPIKGIVANYLLSDEVTTDKDTRDFYEIFAKVMSDKFSTLVFNYLLKKAHEYVKENPGEIKSYVYKILKADEEQRVNFYNTVFARAA